MVPHALPEQAGPATDQLISGFPNPVAVTGRDCPASITKEVPDREVIPQKNPPLPQPIITAQVMSAISAVPAFLAARGSVRRRRRRLSRMLATAERTSCRKSAAGANI